METLEVDVVVIGAGPGGEVAAGRLAAAGLDVAIVEDRLVAGECSYWGCMPSKALLRPGHLLAEVRRVPGVLGAPQLGERGDEHRVAGAVGRGELDVAAVLARRDEVVAGWDDARQVERLDRQGVRLVRGHGRLASERVVRVSEPAGDAVVAELTARRAVVLATGTRPLLPGVPGLREAAPWTNREASEARAPLPRRLAVVGGGPVGCELADAFSALGVTVTLIGDDARLLEKEEEFAGDLVAEALRRRGVELVLGAELTAVRRPRPGGPVTLVVGGGGAGGRELEADELLVAAGRVPNADDLGLETAGLVVNTKGEVEVDRSSQVEGTDWLYAVGDVNGRDLLTHQAKYQAHAAAQAILGRPFRLRDGLAPPPRVTFTDPEVAAAGHTVQTAAQGEVDVRTIDVELESQAGSSFIGKGAGGRCRFLVDREREVLVGATFVGPGVGELIHAATIAITARVPVEELWHAVPPFPGRAEIWLRFLEAYARA